MMILIEFKRKASTSLKKYFKEDQLMISVL